MGVMELSCRVLMMMNLDLRYNDDGGRVLVVMNLRYDGGRVLMRYQILMMMMMMMMATKVRAHHQSMVRRMMGYMRALVFSLFQVLEVLM